MKKRRFIDVITDFVLVLLVVAALRPVVLPLLADMGKIPDYLIAFAGACVAMFICALIWPEWVQIVEAWNEHDRQREHKK